MQLEHEQERSQELLQQLERLSREDPLTGLANRRCWDETLAKEFERSVRHGTDLAILLCDLDRLKAVNDRYGHPTGDRVLQAAAEVLNARVRAGDLAARLGGDEFGVLCPDTGEEAATALAEDLRRAPERAGARHSRPSGSDHVDRRGPPHASRRLAERDHPAGRWPALHGQAQAQRGVPRRARQRFLDRLQQPAPV